jgi:hypothetical protein
MILNYKRNVKTYKFLNHLQEDLNSDTKKMIRQTIFNIFSHSKNNEENNYENNDFIYIILSKSEFYVKV